MSATEENEMIIDLSKVNRSARYGRSETFQRDAFDNMVAKLEELVKNGTNSATESDDISMQRRHDTLFIDGERGTGKTAFLINAEGWLKENNGELWKKTAFIGPVDPTLLFDDENFLGVVLGTIVEKVNEIFKSCNFENSNEEYFKALEKVSVSHKSAFELKKGEISGIDAIASHASSKLLEQHAHAFFRSVAELLGKKVLVLLIDDVDMAFDKGFDVLETIRKFLASPYIVPIVSGDAKLYKHLIKKEFKFSANYRKETGNRPLLMDEEELRKLVDQYFNKVMPNDQRIELKPVQLLRKRYPMLLKVSDKKEIYYNQFKDFEIQVMNYGINQVRFTSQVFPENLRSFVQYLAKKSEVIAELPNDKISLEDKLHESYKPGKEKELVDWLYAERFDLFIRSLEATASFYKYSTVLEEKRLSLMLENDLNAFNDDRISTYSVFKGGFFQDDRFRIEKKDYVSKFGDKRIFCKIIKEKVVDDKIGEIYFQKKTLQQYLKSEKEDEMSKAVTRLFFHDSYYNKASATRAYVVAGKFIEALLYSFDLEDEAEAINKFNEIANGRPFNVNVEKNYIDDDPEENEEDGSYPDNLFNDNIVKEVNDWKNEYISRKEGLLKKHFTTNQLHLILHKFFNNLNALKSSKHINRILSADDPCSFMGRICIILLNAIAFFEKEKDVEESNVAMGENRFNYALLKNKSNPIKKNIEKMLEEKDSLTYTLHKHPFISILMTECNSDASLFNFSLSNSNNIDTFELRQSIVKSEKSEKLEKVRNDLLKSCGISLMKDITEDNTRLYIKKIEEEDNQNLKEYIINKSHTGNSKERRMRLDTNAGKSFFGTFDGK